MICLVMELMGPMALSEAAVDFAHMRFGPNTIAKLDALILFTLECSMTCRMTNTVSKTYFKQKLHSTNQQVNNFSQTK